jgi:hypothetical protein
MEVHTVQCTARCEGVGPHLRRDWARRCHICAGTGLAAATSAPGLGSPLPHLRRDWARRCHICAGTGLTSPHLHRDCARQRLQLNAVASVYESAAKYDQALPLFGRALAIQARP